MSHRIAVIGAGSWGTALSQHLAQQYEVTLWCRRAEFTEELRRTRQSRYLPGIELSSRLTFSASLEQTLVDRSIAVLAVPTQAMRSVLRQSSAWPEQLVLANKGLELGRLLLPHQILAEQVDTEIAERCVVLSGPSFALELARGLPTVVVAAGPIEAAEAIQKEFSFGPMRVYGSSDRTGVELAGALKNVVAVAAGMLDGLQLGHNTVAALITRALVELARLGTAMGARHETFMGLAGLGDLVLTCTGSLSRNRQVGQRLGRGETLSSILASMQMVAEGVDTCRAAHELARQKSIELPIVEQVYAILFEEQEPRRALEQLLSRPLKLEAEEGRR